MTYSYTTSFGGGIILAPCLQQLCYEISIHPEYRHLINLGEIGDRTHQNQGFDSDHNPFVKHAGRRYVRAIDLGGSYRLLMQLRAELFTIYRRHDPRLYPYGYLKGPDSNITDWPPGKGWHRNTGDEGHLHISVTQRDGYNPGPSGWVPALDSRAPWGIATAIPKPKPTPKPAPIAHPEEVMFMMLKPKYAGVYLVRDQGVSPVPTPEDREALQRVGVKLETFSAEFYDSLAKQAK